MPNETEKNEQNEIHFKKVLRGYDETEVDKYIELLQTNLAHIERNNFRITNERDILSYDLEEAQKTIKHLELELALAKEKVEEMESKVKQHQRTYNKLQTDNEELQKKIEGLQQQLREAEMEQNNSEKRLEEAERNTGFSIPLPATPPVHIAPAPLPEPEVVLAPDPEPIVELQVSLKEEISVFEKESKELNFKLEKALADLREAEKRELSRKGEIKRLEMELQKSKNMLSQATLSPKASHSKYEESKQEINTHMQIIEEACNKLGSSLSRVKTNFETDARRKSEAILKNANAIGDKLLKDAVLEVEMLKKQQQLEIKVNSEKSGKMLENAYLQADDIISKAKKKQKQILLESEHLMKKSNGEAKEIIENARIEAENLVKESEHKLMVADQKSNMLMKKTEQKIKQKLEQAQEEYERIRNSIEESMHQYLYVSQQSIEKESSFDDIVDEMKSSIDSLESINSFDTTQE